MQIPTQPQFPPGPFPAAQPRERRRFNALVAIPLSFFSRELYRDVARRWRGMGFWYLVLVMLVAWIPFAVKSQIGAAKFLRAEGPKLVAEFPTITIQDGIVSIAEQEPYLWRDPESRSVILYVDTSDKFDLPEGREAMIRLGKSSLQHRQAPGSPWQTTDLSQVKSFSIDKTKLQNWIEIFGHWVGALVMLVAILALIWHHLQMLLYGAIGLALASMFNARLTFGASMRLAAIALTPAILLDTVLDLAGVNVPFAMLIWIAIEVLYLILAVKSNSEPATTPPGYGGMGYPQPYPAPAGFQVQPGGYYPPPPAPPLPSPRQQ